MTNAAITLDLCDNDGFLSLPDAQIRYLPKFLAPIEEAHFHQSLSDELNWEQFFVRIAGRRIASPRLSAWFGDVGTTYRYSGIAHTATGWPKALGNLKSRVQALTGLPFNSALANLYRDGSDSMGWHSDAEPELGQDPVIVSISLGATRQFTLRHRLDKNISRVRLALEPGSALVMSGPTQHYWRHSLPKTKSAVGPRINLTFRQIYERPTSTC
jgi:alkylated DNA repair dioxygenase AlkB